MSAVLKDDLIKACADAYKTATGTTVGIKAGELAEKIAALGGAKLLESGEITRTSSATSASRATKVYLENVPDMFIFYLEEEDADVFNQKLAAVVGCLCINLPTVEHMKAYGNFATNMNCYIYRDEGSDFYNVEFASEQANVTVDDVSGEIMAKIYGSTAIPLRANTYKWEAYKLWS